MHNPVLSWSASASADVALYRVAWSLNGAAVRTVDVPQNSGFDSLGYSRAWSTDNSDTPLNDGDVVSADVTAVDGGGLVSPVVSASLTIPVSPPDPPTDVQLAL